jgi:hypothetical protein
MIKLNRGEIMGLFDFFGKKEKKVAEESKVNLVNNN